MIIDPLTIAYVAIGAKQALQAHLAAGHSLPDDRFDGECDFIGSIVNGAGNIEALASEREAAGELSGVYVYEVAEPFGYELAELHLAGPVYAPTVRAVAERLINECCAGA